MASDRATGVIGQIGNSLKGLAGGGIMGGIAAGGVAAAAGLVTFGVASVKAAGDYQKSMLQVQALAGVTADQAKVASDAIMKMSTELGQSPKTLADGLYYIASAGYSAGDSLKLLEVSAKAAAVGNTTTETTANALTAAMKAFDIPASDAAKTMDIMTKTVSTGKTEFADYSNVIGKISINAKQAGVSFTEANAAFASLTNVMPSSKQAADALNALLQTSSRFDVLTSRAKSMGLQFDVNAYKTMNLEERLKYLQKITGGNQEEMGKLLGRQNAVAAATILGTNNFAGYNDALKNITNSSGALNAAFAKTSSGFMFQVQRIGAAFQVLLVVVGTKLLPIFTPIAQGFANLISSFTQVVMGSSSVGTAFGKFGPIALQVKGVFILLWDILTGVGRVLSSIFAPAVAMAQNGLKQFAGSGGIGSVLDSINQLLVNVNNAVQTFADWFVQTNQAGKIFAAVSKAISDIGAAIEAAQPFFNQIGEILKQMFIPVFEQLQQAIAQVQPFWKQFLDSIGPALPALKLIGEVIGIVIVGALLLAAYTLAGFLRALILVVEGIAIAIAATGTSFMNALTWATRAWNGIVAVWKAAPAFFTELGKTVQSAFDTAWKWITTQAQNAWKAVQSAWGATGKFFQDIGTTIMQALSSAWEWIKSAASNTWTFIKTAAATAWALIVQVVTAPIRSIVDSFKWLYDHNYYFQDLVDFVKKAFTGLFDWAKQEWSKFTSWLGDLWKGMNKTADDQHTQFSNTVQKHTNDATAAVQSAWTKTTDWLNAQWKTITSYAQSAWSQFTKQVEKIVNDGITAIKQAWTAASAWISGIWNTIKTNVINAVTTMWNQIKAIFSSAWSTYIAQPLAGLMTSITNWANTLVNNAKTWAANMMKGFGQAITSNISAVTTPVTNVASAIASILGFHSPPATGPLAPSATWMPNMMTMYGNGVSAGTTKVTTPVNNMANQVAVSMKNMSTNVNNSATNVNNSMKSIGTQTTQTTNQTTGQMRLLTSSVQGAATGVNQSTNKINNDVAGVNKNIQSINQVAPAAFQNIGTSSKTMATDVGAAADQVKTSTQTVTDSANSVNEIAPPAFKNVGKSATDAGVVVKQAATDIKGAGDDIQASAASTAKVSVVFTTSADDAMTGGRNVQKAAATYVTSGGSAKDAADKFKDASQHIMESAKDTARAAQASMAGDVVKAMDLGLRGVVDGGKAIIAAAQAVASQVAALLGHSKPLIGPLMDDDKWGEHMMQNISGGMQSGIPALKKTTNDIAASIASGLGGSLLGGGNISLSAKLPASSSLQNQQHMTIYMQMDGKTVGKVATKYMERELRVQGNVRNA